MFLCNFSKISVLFQTSEYFFKNVRNFSKICVTFQTICVTFQNPTYFLFRKHTKFVNTTRNPRNYALFGAKVGKPTSCFLQLWSLQYCIQAVDMISACIIIYNIYTIYVQQLCYVEGQQWCCQEADGGTRLERERVDWREGGGGGREGMYHSTN